MAVTGLFDERKVITSFGKFPHSAITILDSHVQGETSHGTGIFVAPNHILTAAHNTYHKNGYGKNDGTRFTISADVNTPKDKGSFFNLGQDNVEKNINYLANFKTGAFADDISLLTTTEAPIAAKNAIGIMAFVNPETAKGFSLKMAGYASDNVGANIKGNSGKANRDLVLAPGDGTGKITQNYGRRIFYSRNVDGATGMSGAPIWHKLEGDKERVLGVHAYGNKLVGNQGVLVTTDIYDKIISQIEQDSGTGNADELPENAIIGSDKIVKELNFAIDANAPVTVDKGDDYIHGSYRKERIMGRSGNDRLFGGDADDRLEGGDGVDQALFSDKFTNYEYTITDPSNPAFKFKHTNGKGGTDSTKDIEFGVFEFEDKDRDGKDDDGKAFYVPLQVDPEDNKKIKDGAIINPEQDIFNRDNEKIGTITVESPAWMFDGDVRYKLNIGSEKAAVYNFAYIIDTSGSMSGGNLAEAKNAYQTLTNSLINNGIAENSEFAVIRFNNSASMKSSLNATSAKSNIKRLSANGSTYFGGALNKAKQFFNSSSNNKLLRS